MSTPKRRRKEPPPHGDVRRYRYWECRCDLCREGERLYCKRRREHRAPKLMVDPTGTIRRVRALVAYGYGFAALGRHLGTSPEWPAHIAYGHTGPSRGIVHRTADRIKALAAELAVTTPPTGPAAAYARTVARKHGWHSFAAWDDIDDPACEPVVDGDADGDHDEVLVTQALAGAARWVDLTHPDRIELLRRAAQLKVGAPTLGSRLGVHPSTLTHYRIRHKEGTAA